MNRKIIIHPEIPVPELMKVLTTYAFDQKYVDNMKEGLFEGKLIEMENRETKEITGVHLYKTKTAIVIRKSYSFVKETSDG